MMNAITWCGGHVSEAGRTLLNFAHYNTYGVKAYEGAQAFVGGLWHATPFGFGDSDLWERAIARNKACAYAGCIVSLAVQFSAFQYFFVPNITIVIPYGAEVVVSGASLANQVLSPLFACISVGALLRRNEDVQERAADAVAVERDATDARIAEAAQGRVHVAIGAVGAWIGRRLIGGWTGTIAGFVVGERIAASVGQWFQGNRADGAVDPNAAPVEGLEAIASPHVRRELRQRFKQIREDLTAGDLLRAAPGSI